MSDYLLRNSRPPHKLHPTLTTLNIITTGDSSSPSEHNVENSIRKQPDPNKDSMISFRIVHSNLDLVGHPAKQLGHTTARSPTTHNDHSQD